jgi:single-stranded-DNA-specific exonuclease
MVFMPSIQRRTKIQRRTLPQQGSLVERLYAARNQQWQGDEQFSLKQLLKPNLLGIDAACELLKQARLQNKKILIVGDFDVDGATSTVLCLQVLGRLGFSVDYLVPSRFEFGYGLTPGIVNHISQQKLADVIITVDNGIASIEGVAQAQAQGMQVIITDHHLPGEQLPTADAIINPNQPGCPFSSKAAAGCTVAFYLCFALVRYFQQQEGESADIQWVLDTLDLVALATIADVVPLDANNRLLVEQGLRRIRAGKSRPGIYALIQVAGKHYQQLSSQDFGFALGPRLNAAGRMDDMSIGIECLNATDSGTALEAAHLLNDLNQTRRAVEADMKHEANQILERMALNPDRLPKTFCLYNPSWHQGVVGLVASRIKEQYHRPVIAFAPSSEQGEIKGSARSIPGIHIRDVLDRVSTKNPGILHKFGGHAMAAGLTLTEKDLAAFTVAFEQTVAQMASPEMFEVSIQTDGPLLAEELTLETAWALKLMSPWGQAFPEPLFDDEATVLSSQILKGQHLKLELKLLDKTLDAIYFNTPKRWLETPPKGSVQVVYQLEVNQFRGQQKLQAMLRFMEALPRGNE